MKAKNEYPITVNVSERDYWEILERVFSVAKTDGRGPKSNYDWCFALDDDAKELINFENVQLHPVRRVIGLSESVNQEMLNLILAKSVSKVA